MSTFTINIQDLRRSKSVYKLSVRWWTSIKDIKDKLRWVSMPSTIHLFCDSRPTELRNNVTLHDLGIESDGGVLKMAVDKIRSGNGANFSLSLVPDIVPDKKCSDLLQRVRLGLERNRVPKKTDMMDSSSGVYFMCNVQGQKVAVFKPQDEEQGMPHNPKGHAGNGDHGLRSHFVPGQGYIREFIAYTMDVDNFCQVPHTTLVNCEHPAYCYSRRNNANLAVSIHSHAPSRHSRAGSAGKSSGSSKVYPKVGSLQHFVKASETFEDLGYSKLTDFEVQKIALLDMRVLNCDRNAANILAVMQQPTSPTANIGHLQTIHSQDDLSLDQSFGGSAGVSGASRFEDEELDALFGRSDSNFGDILDRSMSRDERDVDSSIHRYESNDSTADSCKLEDDIKYRHASATGQGSFDIHTAVGYTLVPIDHGYCFPNDLEVADIDWAWFDYPHVSRPVHPDIKEYIASLNVDEILADITSQVFVSDNCIFLIKVVHKLIQDGIARGLSLKDIAGIIARLDFDTKSKLEVVLQNAEENAYRTIEAHGSGQRARPGVAVSLLSPITGTGPWTESPRSYAEKSAAAVAQAVGSVCAAAVPPEELLDHESLYMTARTGIDSIPVHEPPVTSPDSVAVADISSTESDDTSSGNDSEGDGGLQVPTLVSSPRHHRPSTAAVKSHYIRRQPSFVRENSQSVACPLARQALGDDGSTDCDDYALNTRRNQTQSEAEDGAEVDESAGVVGSAGQMPSIVRSESAEVQFVDIEGMDESFSSSLSIIEESSSVEVTPLVSSRKSALPEAYPVEYDLVPVEEEGGGLTTIVETESASSAVSVVGGGALTRQTALSISTTSAQFVGKGGKQMPSPKVSIPGSKKSRGSFQSFNVTSKRLTSFDPSSLSLPTKSFFNSTACDVEPQSISGISGEAVEVSKSENPTPRGRNPAAVDQFAEGPSLQRVVSFAGFNSDPLYDLNNKGLYGLIRQESKAPGTPGSGLSSTIDDPLRKSSDMGGDSSTKLSSTSGARVRGQERNFWKKMLKERRKGIMDTPAFQRLRYSLACDAVSALIGRCLKEKI